MQTVINEVQDLLGPRLEYCESASLRMSKYVTEFSSANRSLEIKAVCDCIKGRKTAASFHHPMAIEIIATLQENLIVNQSGGILENAGLCLNAFQNYPYIPGSAVKGITSLCAYEIWKDNPNDETMENVIQAFGYPTGHQRLDKEYEKMCNASSKEAEAMAGRVSFLPAVPFDTNWSLVLDICTSHHPEYYQGRRQSATDDEEPNPQKFPAVKKGASFVFRIVPLLGCSEKVLAFAKQCLIDAVTLHGVGAKTAAGYGWFDYSEKQSIELINQKIAAEQRAEKQRLAEEKARAERAQKEAEEKKRLEEKRRQEEATKDMSPEEKKAYEVSSWNDQKLRSKLGEAMTNRNATLADKLLYIKELTSEKRCELWNTLKAITRNPKGDKPWKDIAEQIRKIARNELKKELP